MYLLAYLCNSQINVESGLYSGLHVDTVRWSSVSIALHSCQVYGNILLHRPLWNLDDLESYVVTLCSMLVTFLMWYLVKNPSLT